MPKLAKGDTAPDFELKDQMGKTVKLSEYRGRKVLLYFIQRRQPPDARCNPAL